MYTLSVKLTLPKLSERKLSLSQGHPTCANQTEILSSIAVG